MRRVAPVMNWAAGEARKMIEAATSSTVPARLRGVRETERATSSGG